jgi:small subunit ribosomal protein S18
MTNPITNPPSLKKKTCSFCEQQIKDIDYKNIPLLRPFINYFAKIKPRYYSGVCLKHQKKLTNAIKKSRFIALLPYYS